MSKQWGHGFHKGVESAISKEGYVGLFFHLYDQDGIEQHQGKVLKKIEDGKYLIQYFSYMTGELNSTDIIEFPENTTFYTTDKDMRLQYIRNLATGKSPMSHMMDSRDIEWLYKNEEL